MTTAKVALHVLNAGMVLDRSVLVGQTVEEMKATVATLRASANSRKTVTVIENGALFFTAANMLDIIKSGGDTYKLIAEKAGVTLRDEDVQAIVTAEATKKAIEASMVPPIPPYAFHPVPANWSIKTDLVIAKGERAYVQRRRNNGNGNSTTYRISLLQMKRVWGVASVRWQTKSGSQTIADVKAGGYTRGARVWETHVEIGCQTVQRYELEQLALHLGWDFPTAK